MRRELNASVYSPAIAEKTSLQLAEPAGRRSLDRLSGRSTLSARSCRRAGLSRPRRVKKTSCRHMSRGYASTILRSLRETNRAPAMRRSLAQPARAAVAVSGRRAPTRRSGQRPRRDRHPSARRRIRWAAGLAPVEELREKAPRAARTRPPVGTCKGPTGVPCIWSATSAVERCWRCEVGRSERQGRVFCYGTGSLVSCRETRERVSQRTPREGILKIGWPFGGAHGHRHRGASTPIPVIASRGRRS
jgi:hypothetical protein